MAPPIAEFAAGSAFGLAMFASEIYSPAAIEEQMLLRDQAMLRTYLTAGALSAILVYAADKCNYMAVSLRTPKSLGFSPFDANIIGGALQGIGMSLCASCPASIMVQMGLGFEGSLLIGIGCVLGGLLYIQLAPQIQAQVERAAKGSQQKSNRMDPHTIQQAIRSSYGVALIVFLAMSVGIFVALEHITSIPQSSWHKTAKTGIFIGAAQGLTMLLCRHTIGVSTCFEHLAQGLMKLLSSPKHASASLNTPAVLFATGMASGSLILALCSPSAVPTPLSRTDLGSAIAGGMLMVFGSRLAGGCTSGHGISGVGTLSLSSIVTMVSMYTAGILATKII